MAKFSHEDTTSKIAGRKIISLAQGSRRKESCYQLVVSPTNNKKKESQHSRCMGTF
jgi:hypothetical protein